MANPHELSRHGKSIMFGEWVFVTHRETAEDPIKLLRGYVEWVPLDYGVEDALAYQRETGKALDWSGVELLNSYWLSNVTVLQVGDEPEYDKLPEQEYMVLNPAQDDFIIESSNSQATLVPAKIA